MEKESRRQQAASHLPRARKSPARTKGPRVGKRTKQGTPPAQKSNPASSTRKTTRSPRRFTPPTSGSPSGEHDEQARRHSQDLEFLARAGMRLLQMTHEDQVLFFIGEQAAVLAQDAIILVNSYDPKINRISVHGCHATRDRGNCLRELLGRDPVGLSCFVTDTFRRGMLPGKLQRVPGGLGGLSFEQLPLGLCRRIERALDLKGIYAATFGVGSDLLGTIAILSADQEPPVRTRVIEAFLGQAAAAVHRRRAEEALRRSEQKYTLLFDRAASPTALTKLPENVFVDVNEAFEKLLGYTKQEVIGKTSLELGITRPEEDAVTVSEVERRGMQLDAEEHVRTKSGEERIVSISVNAFQLGDGRYALSTMQDITERKRADEKIESLARFPGENPNPVLRLDATMSVVYANARAAALLKEWDSAVGRPAPDFLCTSARAAQAKAEVRTIDVEVQGRIYSFSVVPVQRAGYTNVYGLDITERKRADAEIRRLNQASEQRAQDLETANEELEVINEELRTANDGLESEIRERKRIEQALKDVAEKYATLFDTTTDGVWIHNLSGEILEVNDAYCRMSGYSRAELLQMPISKLEAVETPEEIVDHIRKLVESGGHDRFESRHRRKDGSLFDVDVTALHFEKEGGRIAIFVRDITERKRAEDVLRASQADLNRAQAVAHTGSWRLDMRRNELLWSDETHRIFGIPAGTQMTYDMFLAAIHPDDRGKVDQAWQAALQGAPYEIEHRIIVQGSVKWVHERAELERDAQGNLRSGFGTVQDVTELKKIQDALRASEARYRTLFSTMTEGFALHEIICDAQGKPVDYRFLEVNPAFESLTGLERENVVGRLLSEVIPNAEPFWVETYGQVALTGEPVHFENYISALKRHYEVFAYSPAPRQFAVLFLNITERKQAEELRQALDTLNVLIRSTVDLEEIMRRAMREAALAFGCDSAALSLREGDHWRVRYVHGLPQDVIGAQMNDDEERHAVLAVQTKKPVAIDDAFNDDRVNRDHTRRWGVRSVLVVPLVVKDKGIGVIFFNYQQSAFAFRDFHIDFGTQFAASLSLALENARLFENLEKELVQRKLADEWIQKLNQDLERRAAELQIANQELEAFATSVGHELRAPLMSLRHLAQVILDDHQDELSPETRALFDLIRANTNEMDELTRSLLRLVDITRQPVTKEQIDPETLIREVLREQEAECAGRQVEITIDPLPLCEADPALLKLVWHHLLSNAIKFTRSQPVAKIEIGARAQGKETVYYCRDNGVGFDASYARTIFQAFQRFHHPEEYAGAGMGLAVVEGIVRRHGGRVWAEGAVNQGATFCFTLSDS